MGLPLLWIFETGQTAAYAAPPSSSTLRYHWRTGPQVAGGYR